jgi:pimeloyl-ACP methyl ester carboxylesterase
MKYFFRAKAPLVLFTSVAISLLGTASSISQSQTPQGGTGVGAGMDPRGQLPALDPSTKRTPVTPGRASGYLYEPIKPGSKSRIGIFVMHSGIDYSNFSTCYELCKRGYTVLCTKNSGGNLNSTLLDAKSSVDYLRRVPGVEKIILWGHSGGATLMSAYQMIAENGIKACQGPEKLAKCPNSLAGMSPADGMILADANWGNAEMALFSLDPAVMREDDGVNLNPDLDLFNPKNGYNANGNSDYSQDFIHNFQSAVGKREMRLIQYAQDRIAAIDAGKGHFADDEPLVLAGAGSLGPNNKLFSEDVRLMSHTVKAWPLIHADGSVTNEIVYSTRIPEGRPMTSMLNMGAINSTVRNFLVDSAIRVGDNYGFDEDSVHGVDWTSSYSSPPGNVARIHVPSLFLGMTGHYEYLAAETIYNNSAATDKSLAFVEGASHMYSTCKQCEKNPGQFGDTIKTLNNYADQWLSQQGRFLDLKK